MEEPLRAIDGLLRGMMELADGHYSEPAADTCLEGCRALAMRAQSACREVTAIWNGLLKQ
jgi:hypothetical protein